MCTLLHRTSMQQSGQVAEGVRDMKKNCSTPFLCCSRWADGRCINYWDHQL